MALPRPSAKAFDAVRRGDADALAALLDEWLPVVLAWCKRLGGPRVDPHDAAQDVLIVVMDRVDRVYAADRLRPWLFGVTRRVLARHRRTAWVKRWVGDLFWDAVDEALGGAGHPAHFRFFGSSQRAVTVDVDVGVDDRVEGLDAGQIGRAHV